MRKVPPGIQIVFGGADGSARSTDATTVSLTGALAHTSFNDY